MPNESRTFDYEPVIGSRPDAAREAVSEAWPRRGGARPDDTRDGEGQRGEARHGEAQAGEGRQRGPAAEAASSSPLLRAEKWNLGRGHAVSFAGLLVFTVMLYFRPQDYWPWLAKAYVALVPAILTLVAFVPSQLAAEGTLTARPREVNLVLLLCAAAFLSVPLAISPPDALDALWESCIKNAITFIFIVNIVRTERRLAVMLWLALGVTALLSVTALNDYRLGNLTVEGYRVEGRSSGGMFENTNDLGIHLVTMLPIAVALGLSYRGLVRKLVFGACAALILATVVVTFSRGAFLGLLASGALLAWKFGRRHRLLVFGALAVTVVALLAAAPGEYWVRLASIFDPSLDRFGSSLARSELLKRSFVVTLANPFFGVGIGNFVLLSPRAQVTHNAYTQVSAEIGIAAALVYTMFLVAPLRRLRLIERETFAERRASRLYYLAVGLQASLVAYMVSSFFASVAFYLYAYYLVGYAVCLRRLHRARSAAGAQNQSAGGAADFDSDGARVSPAAWG
jgi:putative inorganic carbon (HCO3(-)) transporter